jgi:hypothetical protein
LKNFNHLFEKQELIINCKQRDTSRCQWRPTGNIKATAGNNVSVSLACATCDARTSVFLDHAQYKNHEKILLKEIDNV